MKGVIKLKQIFHSNNTWLFMTSNFCPELDLFEGISQKTRKQIYECAITIKNTLFDTEFEEAPEELLEANPLMYRIYESVRGYAYNPDTGWFNMPSTKETMFIIIKVFYRTGNLKI